MTRDKIAAKTLAKENALLLEQVNDLQQILSKYSELKTHLQESESTFKILADSIPACIHILQGNRFVFINATFTALTGYTLKECADIDFWQLVHPEYQDIIRERAWARQRGEEVVPIPELIIRTKYGRDIWVDHTASNTTWNGQPAVIAVLYDLTRRKENEETIVHQYNMLQETYAELEEIHAELQSSQSNLLMLNAQLRDSQQRLDFALWATDDGLWDYNIKTGHLYVNDRGLKMLGYDLDEIKPHIKNWETRVHPSDLPTVQAALKSYLEGSATYFEAEYRLLNKSRQWVWAMSRGKVVKWDHEGNPLRFVGTTRNIAAKKEAELKLKASESRYRHLFEKSPLGLLKIALNGEIQDANEYWVEIMGAPSRQAIIGLNVFKEAEKRPQMADLVRTFLDHYESNHPFTVEAEHTSKWGKKLYMQYKIDLIFDYDKNYSHILVAGEEISARKKAEARIRYLSFNDSLTGLCNRAFFDEELQRLEKPWQLPLSIIMGDVNGLKLANDTFGHLAGDRLLVEVAGILKKCCRPDDIIARWGGDEFLVLLPQTPETIASSICEQIRIACQESNPVPIQPSLALGVATKTTPQQDIYKVISEAENVMYRNKLLENKSIRNSIISSLEISLHEKTFETKEHAERIKVMGIKFGRALNLPDHEIDRLSLLAKLHDIGKIGVPDEILNKPGALSAAEWDSIKKHPEIGYRIVHSSHELMAIAEEVLSHHERWDGSGYPRGLKGEEIPLLARILAIIDAYDVMTHVRYYKNASSHAQAIKEIKKCSGSQFDPRLAELFLHIFENSPGDNRLR